MGPHDNRLIPLSNSVLLYHFSDIRDFIEYGITNLIIWKFTTFTQISYKISAYTTKIRQDGFIRQELLILFFQRNHFLYHVDANTGFIFLICHNCITPIQRPNYLSMSLAYQYFFSFKPPKLDGMLTDYTSFYKPVFIEIRFCRYGLLLLLLKSLGCLVVKNK